MTERRQKGCTPCTNHDGIPAAPYAGGEKDKGEEGTELRIPESFDLGFVDHDDSAAPETLIARTVNPFDTVGVVGNFWRRMQGR